MPTSAASLTAVSISVSLTPGHDAYGLPFVTPSELAHHYNVGVFAPEGVALHGGITSETDAGGHLTSYGMGLFNGFGALYVAGLAPATAAEYRTAADDDPQWTAVSRTIVQVQGKDAVLIHARQVGPLGNLEFRLLWAQGGRVLQIFAPEVIGADAVIAVANATKFFTPSEIDTANIVVDTRPDPTGGPVLYATPGEAAAVLGVPVFAPASYTQVLVWLDRITGKPARWEVDINDEVWVEQAEKTSIPTDAELRASHSTVPAIDHIDIGGAPAAFVKRVGSPSKLYFVVDGVALVITDLSGKRDLGELVGFATGVRSSSSASP